MAALRQGLIAALDIGSTKVACVIARADDAGRLQVIGSGGHVVTRGLRGGVVVDMKDTEDAIRSAVDLAERMAEVTIRKVWVNVSAAALQSQRINVDVSISGHEVDSDDIRNVLDHARAHFDPEESQVLHAMPVSFSIDGSPAIRDPRGMYGGRLGVEMHLLTAPEGPMRNLEHCIANSHLDIAALVASPYASALATIEEDEADLGVTCIDMGGGATHFAVMAQGALQYAGVIPVGGLHVTNDIARGLLTPTAFAERIKTLHGSALPSLSDDREVIDVPQLGESEGEGGSRIERSVLTGIIQPRVEETFELVRERLINSGFDRLAGRRAVLTGGASQLPGVRELASRILEKQVRLARPLRVSGLADSYSGPGFATAVGLLNFAVRPPIDARRPAAARRIEQPTGLLARVSGWVRANF